MLADAQSKFEQMPAGIKNRFKTPADFMQWINNPKNKEEAINMGFANGFDNIDHQGNIIHQPTPEPTPEPAPAPAPEPEPTPQA